MGGSEMGDDLMEMQKSQQRISQREKKQVDYVNLDHGTGKDNVNMDYGANRMQ